ncbi:hypothetical protein BH09PSE6_BH09PSE6_04860 [soil metagenome]
MYRLLSTALLACLAALASPAAAQSASPAPAPAELSPGIRALLVQVARVTQQSYADLDAIQSDIDRRFSTIDRWFSLPALATPAGNALAMNTLDAARASVARRQVLQNALMARLDQLYTAADLTELERTEVRRGHQQGAILMRQRQTEMDKATLDYNTAMRDIVLFVEAERSAGRLRINGNTVTFAAASQPSFNALIDKLQATESRVKDLDDQIRDDSAEARETVQKGTVR